MMFTSPGLTVFISSHQKAENGVLLAVTYLQVSCKNSQVWKERSACRLTFIVAKVIIA